MIEKILSVPAIKNGTVIDHITSDQTLRILRMLRLLERKLKVTVGFNLPSKRMNYKDLIKITEHRLTHQEANEITIFAPSATINIIQDFDVQQKIITTLPPFIKNIFICPNNFCITHSESIQTYFKVREEGKLVKLICHYCEKVFDRNQMKTCL